MRFKNNTEKVVRAQIEPTIWSNIEIGEEVELANKYGRNLGLTEVIKEVAKIEAIKVEVVEVKKDNEKETKEKTKGRKVRAKKTKN